MISKRIGHIALGIIMCMIAGSCGGGSKVIDEPLPDLEEGMVNLVMSVTVPEAVSPGAASRAIVTDPDNDNYFEGPVDRYEKIYKLRVIIVSEKNGTVEHNKMFTLREDGVVRYDDLIFKVRGGDTKTIILIANEDILAQEDKNKFNEAGLPKGVIMTVEKLNAIKAIELPASDLILINNEGVGEDSRSYIPMTEIYTGIEVRYPHYAEDYNQSLPNPLFVTRTAVKFSFNILPTNGTDMYLTDITFYYIANREYLFPINTTYSPAKGEVSNYDLEGRFITKYDIPNGTDHNQYSFPLSKPIDLSVESCLLQPKLYFCESKLGGVNPNPNDKPYSISITVARKDVVKEDGTPNFVQYYTYTPVSLPNLPILPRNTHVKVNMSIDFINAQVTLKPYTGYWLNPSFGIDRDPPEE